MKILFTHKEKGPWIDRDLESLQKMADVRNFLIGGSSYSNLNFLKDIFWCDLVFLWFGTLSAVPIVLLAKIFGKKVYIVSGGFDVAYSPDAKHGAFNQGFISRFVRRILFFLADDVLAVSEFNLKEAKKNAWVGRKGHVVSLSVYTQPGPVKPWLDRKKQVASIFSVPQGKDYLKGFDQLIKISLAMPDVQFMHMGKIDLEVIKKYSPIPKNLNLLGYVEYDSELFRTTLSESKFIFQFSQYESFCSAIVDGGQMGCWPVVSDRGALPELIKEFGDVVPYGNLMDLQKAFREKLKVYEVNCEAISKHFRYTYSVEKREELLRKAIQL